MNFVFRFVRPDPAHKTFRGDGGRRSFFQPRDEGVVGNILDEFDSGIFQLLALRQFERAVELDEIKSRRRDLRLFLPGHRRAVFAGVGINDLVAEPNVFGFEIRSSSKEENTGGQKQAAGAADRAEIHLLPITPVDVLGNAFLSGIMQFTNNSDFYPQMALIFADK